jgi:WS/DGAT/MGAT family acyltransferase
MQRLTGLDATFLYMETPSSPMHVASLLVLDPSTAPDGFSFERLRTLYADRLDQAPPFRRRLVEVPFGLHHPVWIEDPDFDIDYHMRHIAVPQPGTTHELNELVGHLVAMPLDRNHPLWECGSSTGSRAATWRSSPAVHHAAIDGASGEELMVAILDLSPEIEQKPAPEVPWIPDRVPTDTELVGYATVSLAQSPVRAFKAVRRTVEAALQIREANRQPDVTPPPTPFTAPTSSTRRSPRTARWAPPTCRSPT